MASGNTSVDYAFIADLDESAVIKALERIDKEAKILAKSMDTSFKGIERGGRTSFKQLEVAARVALQNINSELSALAQNTANAINIPQISSDQQALQLQQEELKLEQEKIALQRQELGLQNELIAAKERSKIAAQNALQVEISRYPQLNAELQKLAAQYGNFTAVLGRNESELNKEEKEVLDLINRYPQLAGKIDQLTKEYGELNLEIKKSENANKNAGKSALGFAAQLTGIVSVSYLVTNALRNMARAGVEGLKELISNSIVTAQQFDLVHKSIQGILGTDDLGRVDRLFTSIREQSRQLGTNVASIANAFLPLLDSTDQLDKAGELVQELIQLSIVGGRRQTQGDAIRALAEGFSGDFISLRRLFELTPNEIDKIRDTYRDLGTEGFLSALDEVLAKRGIVLSEFQKTTVFRFQQIQEAATDVQNALGQPIDEAIFNFLDRLGNFIDNNFNDILAFANAIGLMVSNLVAETGDTVLDSLEATDFDALFNKIKEFNEQLQETITALNQIYDFFSRINNIGSGLDEKLRDFVGARERQNPLSAFSDFTVELGNVGNSINAFFAKIEARGDAAKELKEDLEKGIITLDEYREKIKIAGNTAQQEVINDYAESVRNATEAVEEFNTSIDEIRTVTPPGQTALDDIEYQLYRLPDQLKALYAQIEELQKPINEARLELEVEFQRRQLEIQKDYIAKQFDLELDASRDREDIEIDFLRKLEDATRDANEKRNEINLDYNRKLEDINRDFDTNLQDLARDSANKRIDIEKDLQSKLAELRRQFLFDAEEAIRQNDAVAFLRLQRKYQFELQEAKLKAEEERTNAVDEEKKKQDELQAKRDEELEKARIDRGRDLEDYKQNVANQLDEIRRARARDLADQDLAEKRKYEDLNLWLQRQTEALNEYYEQKQEDINRQYAEELAKIAELAAERLALENKGLVLSLRQQEAYYRQRQILADKYAKQWLATSGYGGFKPSDSSEKEGGNPANGEEDDTSNKSDAYKIGLSIKRLAAEKKKLTAELTKQIDELVSANKVNDLLALFEDIKAMEHGGTFRANESLLVGEKRPEIVSFDKPGRVIPSTEEYIGELLSSYLSRNQTSNVLPSPGASPIDNSRNYNVDMSMLDPNHLSPGQISIMVEVAKQIVLQSLPS